MRKYLYLLIAVAWAVSLVCVGHWQREDGKTVERASWQARENKELVSANAKIVALEESARTAERKHALQLSELANQLNKDLANARLQKDRDLDAVRSGSMRLRDQFAAGVCTDRDKAGPAGAGAGRSDGPAGCELSSEASQFLLAIVNEADEVVRQLTACQAVVVSDRSL